MVLLQRQDLLLLYIAEQVRRSVPTGPKVSAIGEA